MGGRGKALLWTLVVLTAAVDKTDTASATIILLLLERKGEERRGKQSRAEHNRLYTQFECKVAPVETHRWRMVDARHLSEGNASIFLKMPRPEHGIHMIHVYHIGTYICSINTPCTTAV